MVRADVLAPWTGLRGEVTGSTGTRAMGTLCVVGVVWVELTGPTPGAPEGPGQDRGMRRSQAQGVPYDGQGEGEGDGHRGWRACRRRAKG